MKKVFYYSMTVIMIATFIGFIYALFTGSTNPFYLMFLSIISGLMAMMAEPKATEEQQNKLYGILITVMSLIVIIVMLSMQSCTTTGYGCHGRGKCITRVR